jgi:hypothetical protein
MKKCVKLVISKKVYIKFSGHFKAFCAMTDSCNHETGLNVCMSRDLESLCLLKFFPPLISNQSTRYSMS